MKRLVKVTIGTALASLTLIAPPGASAQSDLGLDAYRATVPREQVGELATEGYDVAAAKPTRSGATVDLVLTEAERARLAAEGVELELVRDAKGRTVSERAAAQSAGGFKVYNDYDDPDDGIRAQLYDLEEQYPDIVDLRVIGTSTEDREIIAMRVTADVASTPVNSRPSVLYQGTTHAREWISTEVTKRLLERVLDKADNGGEIEDFVATRELWFVPVVNPDGYQFTFDEERLWRKNLRDNDGEPGISIFDGVDINRNYPENWNYDDEGSETLTSSETYRGPSAASEPETQADMSLFDEVDFAFTNSYHSYAKLLLYPVGWQVQTPSADDPAYVAYSGTDKEPAIETYDPDLSAELYTTNGEFTDWAAANNDTLAWTTELAGGCATCGFVFPDNEEKVQREFKKNLPFALDLARSADDPADPDSHLGTETEPFYLNVAKIDPTKRHNPSSDFRFAKSYGDPQTVQVLAARDVGAVILHYSINGGTEQTAPTSEWDGGERYGDEYDTLYREMRGNVTGTDPGDSVEVWFEGGGEESEHFTYDAVSETGDDVLVVAAEDYTGRSPEPEGSTPPNELTYLSDYTDALDAGGYSWDYYDVDAEGRTAPDALGVLSHYDAVIQYTGDDVITREADGVPGNASRLANDEVLELRAYLNEGGKLLYTGKYAGNQYAFAYAYDPIANKPCGAGNAQVDARCLLLSDDFLQYYLGAYTYNDGAGTEDELPLDVQGVEAPYTGAEWELAGGAAGNQDHTASFLSTSSLLPEGTYPQFASDGPAEYVREGAAPFEPFDGTQYMYSQRANDTIKRLQRTIDLTGLNSGDDASLSFQTSYDTEPGWDFVIVEAHHPGENDWTTLKDQNGNTSRDVGLSCQFAGLLDDHPFLRRYITQEANGTCTNKGTTGKWNGATGRSDGWEEWEIDLSDYAGDEVELSITYVSDAGIQGIGSFVDDITVSTGDGTTSFEDDADPMDGWTVPGAPGSSGPNPNDWERTESLGFEEGAIASTEDTLYFGFGFEGIATAADRNDVMARSLGYLGVP